ncbi:uncharacterized protein [Halyomorpha halys]|uniref:uncharacterized protein isoform X2 n=1 Tax=Halyomorpha halys TaxID=286706 RepID=UPI0006D4DC63|nr:28 kDa inner dynein arm light chain, axonemal-like isoform X2 [Halyomorpha halys]
MLNQNDKEPDNQQLLKKKDPDQVCLQDILNCIVPPKRFNSGGYDCIQQLSTEPACRNDIDMLLSDLDARLGQLRVRKTGFCPARSQIYEEAFNELIRQITIQSAEQGLLLMRIRNEARMTMKAYQTLYENSNAVAVKTIEQAKRSKGNLEAQIEEVTEELLILEEELVTAQHRYKMVDKRSNEIMYAITVTQENDLGYIDNGIKQIKVIINILASLIAKGKETE